MWTVERIMTSREKGGTWPVRTLSSAKLQHLRLWQRKMVTTFVVSMLTIIIAVPLKMAMVLSQGMEFFLGGFFVVLAIVGGVIQFSARCPNCGARIGMQSRLVLPKRCAKCNISFRAGIE